jgi:hypothetical protein
VKEDACFILSPGENNRYINADASMYHPQAMMRSLSPSYCQGNQANMYYIYERGNYSSLLMSFE